MKHRYYYYIATTYLLFHCITAER